MSKKNMVHLCDSCMKEVPSCDGFAIEYGGGVGKDNITACGGYVPCSTKKNAVMRIEQIAIAAKNPEKVIEHLAAIGLTDWCHDEVVATGEVFGVKGTNTAELHFNYQLGFELEILKYVDGPNWHTQRNFADQNTFASHMGLHVTAEQMELVKAKMEKARIRIAQEVYTDSHTNKFIDGKRKYHYVVFDSLDAFGFDLKLIERIMI